MAFWEKALKLISLSVTISETQLQGLKAFSCLLLIVNITFNGVWKRFEFTVYRGDLSIPGIYSTGHGGGVGSEEGTVHSWEFMALGLVLYCIATPKIS